MFTRPPQVPAPEVVLRQPPDYLLTPCDMPALKGDTNGALLDWAVNERKALESCNGQLKGLRQWKSGVLQ